jgi:peroxiredoxin
VSRTAAAALALLGQAAAALPVGAEPAPAFTLRLLGSAAVFDSRSALEKKILVVRFQASWCRPCAREAAALERFYRRYRRFGVEVVGIHVQDAGPDARRFLRAHGGTYPAGLDPRLTVSNRFGVEGTPYTVVIAQDGELVARIRGESAVRRLPAIVAPLTRPAPPAR